MDITTTTTAAEQRPSTRTQYLVFTGTGGEYFRIWIVNLLLTIVTLGIYSAWAKVRRLRYFYGSTLLDGTSFEYHANPIKVLKGRLIAAAFVVPFFITLKFWPPVALGLGIALLPALPFLIVQSRRFHTRNSSWRDIRFDFEGTYKDAAIVHLALALLVPLTLGLIVPYIAYRRQKLLIGKTKFGASQVEFDGTVGKFYLAFLSGIALAAGGVAAFAFLGNWWLGPIFRDVFLNMDPQLVWHYKGQFLMLWVIWFYIWYFAYSVVQARLINATYGHLRVGGHRVQSEVEMSELAGIHLSNMLFTWLTLGFYWPWAKLRILRYRIQSMSIVALGGLGSMLAAENQDADAVGSEVSDFLDLDFGL